MSKIILVCSLLFVRIAFAQPQLVGTLSYDGTKYGGGIFRLNLPPATPGIIHSFDNLAPHRAKVGLCAANDDWLYGMLTFNGTNNNGCIYKITRAGTNFTVVHNLDYSAGIYVIPYLHTDGNIYFSNEFQVKKMDTVTNTVTNLDLSAGIASRNLLIDASNWIYFVTTIHTIAKIKTDGTLWTELHTFNGPTEGNFGRAGLTETPGDTLFGVMNQGGSSDAGTIFSIKKDGTGFFVHHQFTGATGKYPESKLVYFDGKLFGTTTQGGNFDNGVLFTINPNGTGYRVLHHFDPGSPAVGSIFGNISIASNGRVFGSFYQFLYSPFPNRLFKVDTSGDHFEPFLNASLANQHDVGHFNLDILLVDDDETIFLTTSEMGKHDGGVISTCDTSGNGSTGLYHFGLSPNGFRPINGLIKGSDGKLYGTAYIGGTTGNGVVFSMNTNGTGYTKIHEFTDAEGFDLSGKLLEASDGKLYGSCKLSTISSGAIYRLDKNGSNFQVVHAFMNVGEGYSPLGSLVEDGGMLYGTTLYSTPGSGCVFKMNKDGTNYSVLKNFDFASGLAYPSDGVIVSGNHLYGHCNNGGPENKGGVFRIQKDGSNYQELRVFNGATDGSSPYGIPVMASNGKLYGVTHTGGSNFNGTVYRMDPDGSNYSILRNFSDVVDGGYPRGLMQASDGLLYGGTTVSAIGAGNGGTVFRLNADGSIFTVIREFNTTTEGQVVSDLLDLTFGALPVQLLTFKAQKKDGSVLLTWKTAQEQNSDRFEIERSADGIRFNTLGFVAAAGNTNTITSYEFTDRDPFKGINFYRLKEVDKDGKFMHSSITSVKFSDVIVMLTPNPVSDKLTIRLTQGHDFTSLRIFDASGKMVIQKNNIPSTNLVVDVQGLLKGWYILQLNGKSTENYRFIKE